MPLVTVIVATDPYGGIGYNGALPWPRIPEDMKRFRDRTMGDVVVMGRKTYDSIGKPLQGRTNVVLTRDARFSVPGVIAVRSIEEALNHPSVHNRPVWIAGGVEVYEAGLDYAHAIEQTLVLKPFECDRFFPRVQLGQWSVSWRGERVSSTAGFDFREVTYVRETQPG